MFRTLIAFLIFSPFASAQLQVSTPAATPCPANAMPVLGVVMDTTMNGDYGFQFHHDLQEGLERAGFRVVPDYSSHLPDLASIGIRGTVSHWKSRQGKTSDRVGAAHLIIYDIDTGKTILNLDQNPNTFVLNALRYQDFVTAVVDTFSKKFCQQ